MNIELHQLDLRYETLRTRKPEAERKLLASLADIGQRFPTRRTSVAPSATRSSCGSTMPGSFATEP